MRHLIHAKKLTTIVSVAAGALLLQACASTSGSNVALKSGTSAHANAQSDTSGLDPVASAAFWGTRYDREPQNPSVAVKFSSALRKIGSFDESLKVISRVAGKNPDDADVMLEYGKSLIESDRAFEAVRPIEYALAKRPDDWRILSAYGVALDQIGEHDVARQQYDLALSINPTAVSVINNKGLSYALSGDLDLARNTLTRATGDRHADAKVRQNLALVMALRGDLAGAERLARSDLPPQLADNNVEVFRTMLNQPAYWQDFAANGVTAPDFDAVSSFEEPALPSVEETVSTPSVPVVEPTPLPSLPEVSEPVTPAPAPLEPAPLTVEPEFEEFENADDGVPLVFGPVTRPSVVSLSAPQNLTAIDDPSDTSADENELPVLDDVVASDEAPADDTAKEDDGN